MTEEAAPQGAPDADKATAAIAETDNKPKSQEWRGIALELPPELPGSTAFDIADFEDGQKSLGPLFGMLKSIIGPDQFFAVRDKVREDNLDLTTTLEQVMTLLNDVVRQYGIELGESPASEDS